MTYFLAPHKTSLPVSFGANAIHYDVPKPWGTGTPKGGSSAHCLTGTGVLHDPNLEVLAGNTRAGLRTHVETKAVEILAHLGPK